MGAPGKAALAGVFCALVSSRNSQELSPLDAESLPAAGADRAPDGETPPTGHLQRIRFNDRWEEIGRESMLLEFGQRIRDVRQGPGGLLYVPTAEQRGALLRIEPRE